MVRVGVVRPAAWITEKVWGFFETRATVRIVALKVTVEPETVKRLESGWEATRETVAVEHLLSHIHFLG